MDFKEFTFEFEIDGKIFEPSPEDIDIVMHDSLHSFFCGGEFSIVDHSSVFQEYRLLNDGMPFKMGFSYADEDAVIKCPYIIDSSGSPAGSVQFGIMVSKIVAKLNHQEASKLSVGSFAYPGSIADAVPSALEGLTFEEVLVASTTGTGTWYQPLMNQKDFIEKILLKRAYTDASPFSPFFSFTTSDNVFHFEDLATLLAKSSKQEFIYRPFSDLAPDPNQIATIIPMTNGVSNGRKSWNRTIHSISRADFEETEETRLLTDRLFSDPLIIGDAAPVTDHFAWGLRIPDDALDESLLLGEENYKSRRVFFQESFLITTMKPFTNVHAGDKITLSIATKDSSGYANSLYSSGDYIVETSSHEWVGKEEKGFSTFLVSRDSAVIPNDHNVSEKMFK